MFLFSLAFRIEVDVLCKITSVAPTSDSMAPSIDLLLSWSRGESVVIVCWFAHVDSPHKISERLSVVLQVDKVSSLIVVLWVVSSILL